MRVTVCQLRNDPSGLEEDWKLLAEHLESARSDLLLLPEMPLSPWLAGSRGVDPAAWARSVRAHDEWIERFGELGVGAVLSTRPVIDEDRRYNQALAWSERSGEQELAHRKRYLPDEAGFWEASWYHRGEESVGYTDLADARIGFAICTELWFFHRARALGKLGVHLLACPRATYAATTDKWLAGGRSAAVVSGAYCLSSNFFGAAADGVWGGSGWIIEPEDGEIVAVTSETEPFMTRQIDLETATAAKVTYPRYVGGD